MTTGAGNRSGVGEGTSGHPLRRWPPHLLKLFWMRMILINISCVSAGQGLPLQAAGARHDLQKGAPGTLADVEPMADRVVLAS
jgi:hypothetical protein